MIVITKNSKLYKLYSALGNLAFFSFITPKKQYNDNEITTFRDLCTFLRTTILYLLISIPSIVLFIGMTLYTLYAIVCSIFTMSLLPAAVAPLGIFLLAIVSLVAFTIIVLGGKAVSKIGEFTTETLESPSASKVKIKAAKSFSFIKLIFEALKAKHDKICKVIDVKDD